MSETHVGSSTPFGSDEKVMLLGIFAVILTLVISTLFTWMWSEEIRSTTRSEMATIAASERLERYGTVLGLSIKQVASTGDAEAAARYRATQPSLRQSLNNLRAELELSPNNRAVAAVDQADLDLVEMEYEALELAGRGKLAEARSIIFSERYDQLAKSYFAGIREIQERAREHLAAAEEELSSSLAAMIVMSIASSAVLLIAWIAVALRARSWADRLREARDQAERALEELKDSRAQISYLQKQAERSRRLMQAVSDTVTKDRFQELADEYEGLAFKIAADGTTVTARQ